MPVIIKLEKVISNQTQKRDAILALIEIFSKKGSEGDFAAVILRIAAQHKVPADFLLKQALGILFSETGYLTSQQFTTCNQGGMMSSAPNWIGGRTVRADTLINVKNVPPVYVQYFDTADEKVYLEVLDNWFKRKDGTYAKYVAGGGTYPILKEAWMGVVIKLLYLVTDKSTTNTAVLAVAPSYGEQLWSPYAKNGVSAEYKAGVLKAAKNTLIYNSQGTIPLINGYKNLIEGVKKNFSITIY